MDIKKIDNIDIIRSMQLERKNLKYGTIPATIARRNVLNELLAFSGGDHNIDLQAMRIGIDKTVERLMRISNILKSNKSITSVKDIELEISKLPDLEKLNAECETIELNLQTLLKSFDLCPTCLGSRSVYDAEEASGDPYARSCDYRKACPKCNGTGKHPDNIAN